MAEESSTLRGDALRITEKDAGSALKGRGLDVLEPNKAKEQPQGIKVGKNLVAVVEQRDGHKLYQVSNPYVPPKEFEDREPRVRLTELNPAEGQLPATIVLGEKDLITKLSEEDSPWSIATSEKIE